MNARYITETDVITKGMTLLHKHPNFSTVSQVIVTKVTKNTIQTEQLRYTKDGCPVGDRFPRRMLYMPVGEREALQAAWDALQATPAYVERTLA